MRKIIIQSVLAFIVTNTNSAAPPGFNPGLSIEEHRRQQEMLRKQNQKIADQNLEHKIEEDAKIFIRAQIIDLFSEEPVDGTVSYLFLKTGREREFKKEKGQYTTTISKFSDTRIIFRARNYFDNALALTKNDLAPLEQIELNMKLIRRGANGISEAVEIFFDGDSHALKEEFYAPLDTVVSTLNANKKLSLLINGYSGRQGGETAAAQQMSVKRAEAVAAYLVQKGIAQNRINAVGLGKTEETREIKFDYRAEVYILEE